MSGATEIETDALVEAAAEDARADPRDEMPLPDDMRTVFLGGLFFLASMAALYVTSEIVMPLVLAIVLKLLLQPIVRGAERLHLPRFVGALFCLILVLGCLAGMGTLMSGPAATWAARLPAELPRLQQQLHFLMPPIDGIREFLSQVQGSMDTTTPSSAASPVRVSGLVDTLFSGTKALAAGFFTMLVVLFYLLVFGETFLRRFVEILPRFGDKRRAVEISLHIERDISAYLLAITAINAVVGLATGVVMWSCGIGDAVLWGVAAFALNYVPILGAFVGIALFSMLGVLTLGPTYAAFLPALLYFAIHVIEGEVATPMLLARRFTINPVAVILGLVFWYWMWGVPGAVLAVPMLAIAKIICDDVPPLRAFGHFLEG